MTGFAPARTYIGIMLLSKLSLRHDRWVRAGSPVTAETADRSGTGQVTDARKPSSSLPDVRTSSRMALTGPMATIN